MTARFFNIVWPEGYDVTPHELTVYLESANATAEWLDSEGATWEAEFRH